MTICDYFLHLDLEKQVEDFLKLLNKRELEPKVEVCMGQGLVQAPYPDQPADSAEPVK